MIDRYPHKAGHRGDNETSIQASEELQEHLGRLQASAFGVIAAAGPHGASCDDIAAELDWIVFRVRPRTAELRRMGKIVDSGNRRKGASGRLDIVWCLPEYRRQVTS